MTFAMMVWQWERSGKSGNGLYEWMIASAIRKLNYKKFIRLTRILGEGPV